MYNLLNPLTNGGGAVYAPPVVFCPLLKKSSGNPYLKFLTFPNFLLLMPLGKKN